MFDFQKLTVYKKSNQFHTDCKKLIERVEIKKHVSNQLARASYSIPLNIAEGSGKFSHPDRRRYFIIARASIFECVAILEILEAEGKISSEEFAQLADICDQLSRMLFRMISNLQESN